MLPSPTSCQKQCQHWIHIRLLRALSSQVLEPSRTEVQQPLQAPVQLLGYHQGEKYFIYMESEPALFQFMIDFAHHSVHLTVCLLNNLLLAFWWRLLNCLSLLQTKQAQFPESFLIGHVLQPTDHFCGPLLTSERSLWSGRPWEQHLHFLWRFSSVFKRTLHRKQQPPSSSCCSDCDVLNPWQKQELLVPKQMKK